MEKSAKYNGMTFSHYCRFLDELHWETLTPEVKEAIKLTRL